MTLLLTLPFTDETVKPTDDASRWAWLRERVLRELAYRETVDGHLVLEASVAELVVATDAGQVCHVCGDVVSWVDHLPPAHGGGPVRCMRNVHGLRIVDGADRLVHVVEARSSGHGTVYSAEFQDSPKGI